MRQILTLLLFGSITVLQAQTLLSDYWATRQPDNWLKYQSITPVNKEVAIVRLHGKSGLLHISGKELTPLIYTHCTEVKGQDFFRVSLYSKNGIIKSDGTMVIPVEYETVLSDSTFFEACSNGVCTRFTRTGVEIPQKSVFKGIKTGSQKQDGFIEATINGTLWGVVDSTGQWVIEPQFTFLHTKERGYWSASIGRYNRLIHPGKKWVGKEVFYSIDWLTDNGFWARKGDYSAPLRFYNYEEQVQKQFPAVERVNYAEKHRILFNNEKCSLIDLNNNVVLAGYDQIMRYFPKLLLPSQILPLPFRCSI